MRILSVSQCVLTGLLVSLLVSVSFCHGDDKTVEVVGLGECADCQENNIMTSHAFSGIYINIFPIMFFEYIKFFVMKLLYTKMVLAVLHIDSFYSLTEF